MEGGLVTYLIIAGTILFGLYIIVFFVPFGLWITAKVAGVRITLLELIDMKMRRVAPSPIVRSLIMAVKADIEIQLESLEEHSMAGGNVENVITTMIKARNKNKQLSFEEACERDLANEDLTKQSK